MIWVIGILLAAYAILKLRKPALSREPTPGFDLVQGAFLNPKTKEVWTVDKIKAYITSECMRLGYGFPNIAIAIVTVESRFRLDAVNPEIGTSTTSPGDQPDSIGLFQMQFATALKFVPYITSPEDLKDPRVNVPAGIGYLKYLHSKWFAKYGHDGVIQMFNLGETRYFKGSRATSYLSKVKNAAGLR